MADQNEEQIRRRISGTISRIWLDNGVTIQIGDAWMSPPESDPVNLKVGAILYRPEISTSLPTGDDDEEGDAPVVSAPGSSARYTVNAHYEVWGRPNEGSQEEAQKVTVVKRVPASRVFWAEEVWNLGDASYVLNMRMHEHQDEVLDEVQQALEDHKERYQEEAVAASPVTPPIAPQAAPVPAPAPAPTPTSAA
jgi:hypothetical protein